MVPKIERWEREIKVNIDVDMFVKCLRDIRITTNIAKYCSFQFRLLHRAVITNIHLYHWGKKKDNLCTFCQSHPETYTHLFVMCTKIRTLCIETEKLMYVFNDEDICFNVENVMTDRLVPNPANVKNFIGLLTKQYIYRKRCFCELPNYRELENIIWHTRNMERYIAIKNCKQSAHHRKWTNKSLTYYEQNNM